MLSIWAELKRRNVVKVAIAYGVVSWLLIQVAATVFPILGIPDWAVRFVTLLLIIGFPIALIIAWAFELTPEGIKQASDDELAATPHKPARLLILLVIGTIGLGGLYIGTDSLFRPDQPERSIAVLPFVNMSSDPEQEYFSDGIAAELLNRLARLPDLQVAGRTSSFAFKDTSVDVRDIGQRLNVANILEGSVRKSGDQVRITVQLIKAADGFELWSESYEERLDDIFAIQNEIATSIADALSVTLGVGGIENDAGGTRMFEAYDAYLEGLALENQWGHDNLLLAIERFEEAVELDPGYADAWGELAFAYGIVAMTDPERARIYEEKSAAATTRTREIAPNTAATYLAEAHQYERDRRWLDAEQAFVSASERAPTSYGPKIGYGSFLLVVGRPRDAIEYLRQAARIEPMFLSTSAFLGEAYMHAGNIDVAFSHYERSLELVGDPASVDNFRLLAALAVDDRELIETSLQTLLDGESLPPDIQSLLETMRSRLDAPDDARLELRKYSANRVSDDPLSMIAVAAWAAYFDDEALALDIFQGLYGTGWLSPFPLWSPIYSDMRQLPGFKELIRQLGLVDYWRQSGNWSDFCRPSGGSDLECI